MKVYLGSINVYGNWLKCNCYTMIEVKIAKSLTFWNEFNIQTSEYLVYWWGLDFIFNVKNNYGMVITLLFQQITWVFISPQDALFLILVHSKTHAFVSNLLHFPPDLIISYRVIHKWQFFRLKAPNLFCRWILLIFVFIY